MELKLKERLNWGNIKHNLKDFFSGFKRLHEQGMFAVEMKREEREQERLLKKQKEDEDYKDIYIG